MLGVCDLIEFMMWNTNAFSSPHRSMCRPHARFHILKSFPEIFPFSSFYQLLLNNPLQFNVRNYTHLLTTSTVLKISNSSPNQQPWFPLSSSAFIIVYWIQPRAGLWPDRPVPRQHMQQNVCCVFCSAPAAKVRRDIWKSHFTERIAPLTQQIGCLAWCVCVCLQKRDSYSIKYWPGFSVLHVWCQCVELQQKQTSRVKKSHPTMWKTHESWALTFYHNVYSFFNWS